MSMLNGVKMYFVIKIKMVKIYWYIANFTIKQSI